jgi:CBS domain-containing protein
MAVSQFFSDTTHSHFPVVVEGKFLGMLAKEEVENFENKDLNISELIKSFEFFRIDNFQNIMDVLKVFASNNANVIPVVEEDMNYLGYFDLSDVMHLLNTAPFFDHEGESILLEKDTEKYSFSEICQIVESNKGKVLCSFVADINEAKVKISLKFEAPEINEIIQTFRRYDYTILSDHKEDFYLEDLKSRSEYLQKYLNI